MRYSPLAASNWPLHPGGVCPTLPSFVKLPKSFDCGKATTTASAMMIESAQTGTNDLFFRIIFESSPFVNRAEIVAPQFISAKIYQFVRPNGRRTEAFYIILVVRHCKSGGDASRRATW
jgi:hypothetical protein